MVRTYQQFLSILYDFSSRVWVPLVTRCSRCRLPVHCGNIFQKRLLVGMLKKSHQLWWLVIRVLIKSLCCQGAVFYLWRNASLFVMSCEHNGLRWVLIVRVTPRVRLPVGCQVPNIMLCGVGKMVLNEAHILIMFLWHQSSHISLIVVPIYCNQSGSGILGLVGNFPVMRWQNIPQ